MGVVLTLHSAILRHILHLIYFASQGVPPLDQLNTMDPLSITANVTAIINLAQMICSACSTYVSNFKDAPYDLRRIMMEVGSLECTTKVIQCLISGPNSSRDSAIFEYLNGSDGPLQICKRAVSDLKALFPPMERAINGKRRKVLPSLERLAWPLKANKAHRLLDEIGHLKITISLALTTQSS